MNIEFVKQFIIKSKKEFPIKKEIVIDGVPMLLICITQEKYGNRLWILHEDMQEEFPWEGDKTNRDAQLRHIRQAYAKGPFNIQELKIQGQKIKFGGANSNPLNNVNIGPGIIQLAYFIKKGYVNTSWLKAEKLVLTSLEIRNTKLPKPKKKKNPSIRIKLAHRAEQIIVQEIFTFPVGEAGMNAKFTYTDKASGKEAFFYLNRIELFDPWDEDALLEDMRKKGHDMSEENTGRYIKLQQHICSPGQKVPLIYYETEDNRQLQFFTTHFLEEPVKTNYGSASAFLFMDDRKTGNNGLPSRICALEPVEKDFTGELQVELLSYYIHDSQEKVIKI